jgi:hypothetical protein
MKSQQGEYPIANGRPADLRAPPITLYHPVFAEFLDAISEQDTTPTPETYTETHIFLEAAAIFYDNEDRRIDALKPSLTHLIGEQVKMTLSGGSQLNGAILTGSDHGRSSKLLADVEWRNEMSVGTSELGMQAGMGYRKFWVQPEVRGTS